MSFMRTAILGTAALLALNVGAAAETPPDTLVIADTIDDIVSLDPAESFEFSGNDALNNIYDRLIMLDPANDLAMIPGLAESWEVSEDGKTYTFKIREGVTSHAGNPITADDAAWSLQRAVKLDKTPSFILTQFGFTADNVEDLIKAEDDTTLTITTDRNYAPSFFYNILTSVVASIVDKDEAMANETDGDMGYEWMKTHTAGSGPYMLRGWKPSDSLILEKPDDWWGGEVAMARVFVRHVPELATQRLLLERGDIDIARRLTPSDVEAVESNPDLKILEQLRGRIFYLALNQKVEELADPKVIEAIRYLIDYDGIVDNVMRGLAVKHQAFLPVGLLGAVEDTPYSLDVEKAKGLLAEAGYEDGFEIEFLVRNDSDRLEMAQTIQNTLGQAGIRANIKSATGAEVLGEYRARKHELILENWGPDYPDPHTNADAFADNPDNSDEAQLVGKPVWRTAYPAETTTPMVQAAVVEKDTGKREEMYQEMQRDAQANSPLIFMLQEVAQTAMQQNVDGFSAGGAGSSAFYWPVTKSAE